MISSFDQVQRGSRTESLDNREEKIGPGEGITSPLQEEHRQTHLVKVIGAFGTRLARRMEGKPEEDKTFHFWKRGHSCSTRGHPSTE